MFQSPLAQLPSIAQFSNASRTPLSAARRASSPQTFLNCGRLASIGWPRTRPVKPAIVRGAEMVRVVDQRFPSGKRLPIEIAVLERIAEHAERIDRHVGVADRLAQLPGQQRQILVHGLPEERLDAFEAKSDDLAHIRGRIRRIGADHCSDADVEQRSH